MFTQNPKSDINVMWLWKDEIGTTQNGNSGRPSKDIGRQRLGGKPRVVNLIIKVSLLYTAGNSVPQRQIINLL